MQIWVPKLQRDRTKKKRKRSTKGAHRQGQIQNIIIDKKMKGLRMGRGTQTSHSLGASLTKDIYGGSCTRLAYMERRNELLNEDWVLESIR
jgi:hypothetical protein